MTGSDLTPSFEPTDWEARLKAAVEKTLAARAAQKADREEFRRRRAYGLQKRHATKLATDDRGQPRGRGSEPVAAQANPGGTMPDKPPCCAGLDEPCPQHRQAQRAARFEGPSKRGGRSHRVLGESGKTKPVRPAEEDR